MNARACGHWRWLGRGLLVAVCWGGLLRCDRPSQSPALASGDRLNDAAADMGQFEFARAETAFAALLREDPSNDLLKFNLALARMNNADEGSQSVALAQFRELFLRKPMDLRARYGAALCLLYLGRPEESAPQFAECAALSPNDAYAAYFLGASFDAMSQPAEALKWFQKAAQREPLLKSAWLGVQRCARRTGDEALAASALATFEALLEHPRALTAEFKYTRMGALALVALPEEPLTAEPTKANFADCFAAAEPLVVEGESADALRWSCDSLSSAVTVDLNLDSLQDIIVLRAFAAEGTGLPPNAVLLASERGSYTLDRAHPAAWITDVRALLVGDINNDSRDDLYFCREANNVLLMRESDSEYRDATAEFGVAGSGNATVDGTLTDLDHDGDLDLFLVHDVGKNELLANNANGSFRALGAQEGLAFDERPSRQVLVTDVDRDRDVDIVVLKAQAPHEIWLNDRIWRWRRASVPADFLSTEADALVGLDNVDDATRALVTLGRSGVRRFSLETPVWMHAPSQGQEVSGGAISIADIDGDGQSEVLEQHRGQTTILTTDLSALHTIPSPPNTLSSFVLDLDAVRGASMLYLRNAGAPMIAGAGKSRMQFAALRLRGRLDPSQSMRSNASGLGASVAARVGSSWVGATTSRTSSRSGQSLAPIPIGLGNAARADFVEIDWSDGVMQTERTIRAGEIASIVETQRQLSSCPVLFAFDGTRMQFITDLLGVGGVGYLLEPGVYSEPRPHEVLVLPEGALAPSTDGRLRVALAEPMEESCMLDSLSLCAVDLPSGWDVAPDERLHILGPPPTGALVAWREEWLPTTEPALRVRDGVALELPEHDHRFIGRLASEVVVALDFELAIASIDDPWLVIDGWVEYPYCQTMFASWQAGAKYRAPSLEARAQDGSWKELVAEWGYPAGMPRRMALPVPRADLPEGCTQLRMRTNMEVYFDAVRLVKRESLPVDSVELALHSASLSRVGFARRSTLSQARPFYDHAQRFPLWDCRTQRGLYTELGDVRQLMSAADDALVVFGPGEEIAFAFDAPQEAIAPGTTRRFVLTARGWCKDMDLFTRDGETIEPLPSSSVRTAGAEALMQQTRTRRMGGR